MAQGDRVFLSLPPDAGRMMESLAAAEGVSNARIVERALETRYGLVDLASRLPRDERGRLVRMAVLPEGVPAPTGAEVFRLYLPLPDQDPYLPSARSVSMVPADMVDAVQAGQALDGPG